MSKTIKIFATTDVHGCVFPVNYADGTEQLHGLAAISNTINTLKDENSIVIDNGDMLEGSPLSFYHFLKYATEVTPMSNAMKKVGYDFVNLGNHDFNYGKAALLKHLEYMNIPCISSNIFDEKGCFSKPYWIKESAGVRIAFVGVTTQYIVNWESKEHLQDIYFKDALETLRENVACAYETEHPDYIVGVYHGGFERDLETGEPTEDLTGENEGYQMLFEVPHLDVLISGHQHRTLAGEKNGVVYTQTGANGFDVACIEINPETHEITPSLIHCAHGVNEDVLTDNVKEENECQVWLDQTLGTCNIDLEVTDEDDARLNKTQLITFLNKVQIEVTGADLSATALFLHATGFKKEITMRNLVSTYVYPNTLVIKKVTGKVLREYLEKDAEFWSIHEDGKVGVNPAYDEPKPQHYNYDMVDGIEYTIKVSNPVGSRITSLTRNGIEVKDDDVLTFCLNNYRASGGGNYNMIPSCETIAENQSSMVELLAEYIMKHKVIDFEPVHNIKVIA